RGREARGPPAALAPPAAGAARDLRRRRRESPRAPRPVRASSAPRTRRRWAAVWWRASQPRRPDSGRGREWRGRRAGRERQYLVALLGDEDRVLPLRREAVIGGDDRPPVGEAANGGATGVDHRLDRENHARLKFHAGAGLAVMQHLRLFVELAADAVPAEFAHHRKAMALGEALDRCADVAEAGARLDLAYTAPHRRKGHFAQPLGLDRRRADVEHPAGVAVEAVLDHRDVDVDDVAGLEHFVARDAVADN